MTHKLIPLLLVLAGCGGQEFAPQAALPGPDAGTIVVRLLDDGGSPSNADAGEQLDAGRSDVDSGADAGTVEEVDSGTPPDLDAGSAVDAGADAGQPVNADAGDWCDSSENLWWLVNGQTCGQQIHVTCIASAQDSCGFLSQPPCDRSGNVAAGSEARYCVEGFQPYGPGGTCARCH